MTNTTLPATPLRHALVLAVAACRVPGAATADEQETVAQALLTNLLVAGAPLLAGDSWLTDDERNVVVTDGNATIVTVAYDGSVSW